jgi:hypothetical protein
MNSLHKDKWQIIDDLWKYWQGYGLCSDNCILHYDHAPEHDELRVGEFPAKKSITKWTIHLIHLTADCDFWLFPKSKMS